jgi:hypothetical protein
VNAQRILAVLAAILFVGAVGLATIQPRMVTMAFVLTYLIPDGDVALHKWLVQFIGAWSWDNIAQPLLIRPAWLPFGSLGLVCAGVSLTLPARDARHRSHRRS